MRKDDPDKGGKLTDSGDQAPPDWETDNGSSGTGTGVSSGSGDGSGNGSGDGGVDLGPVTVEPPVDEGPVIRTWDPETDPTHEPHTHSEGGDTTGAYEGDDGIIEPRDWNNVTGADGEGDAP
jgi:hypothetical protein